MSNTQFLKFTLADDDNNDAGDARRFSTSRLPSPLAIGQRAHHRPAEPRMILNDFTIYQSRWQHVEQDAARRFAASRALAADWLSDTAIR